MRKSIKRVEERQLLILELPAIIKTIIFAYLPMIGIILAFKELNYNSGIFSSPWVGLKNFEFFFKSADAVRITKNTIFMNGIFIISGTAVSILFSLLLYQISTSKIALSGYQTIMFFPYFLSWVVVGLILENVIGSNGFINQIIELCGGTKIQFYQETKYWYTIMGISNLWKNVGYYCIIYYAVLVGTDTSLYEAAKVDGANSWHIMTKLQIHFLKPMIALNVLLGIGNIFRADFGMFNFLPGASNTVLLPATDVIDTYVYRSITGLGNLSMGTAVGLYQSFVGLILISVANYIAKKADASYAIY